jgi:hypothetical protein
MGPEGARRRRQLRPSEHRHHDATEGPRPPCGRKPPQRIDRIIIGTGCRAVRCRATGADFLRRAPRSASRDGLLGPPFTAILTNESELKGGSPTLGFAIRQNSNFHRIAPCTAPLGAVQATRGSNHLIGLRYPGSGRLPVVLACPFPGLFTRTCHYTPPTPYE